MSSDVTPVPTRPRACVIAASEVPDSVRTLVARAALPAAGSILHREVLEARREAAAVLARAETSAAAREREAEQAAVARLESASREAEQLREAARAEAEVLREQARAAGFREGRDAGAAELTTLVAQAGQRLASCEREAEPRLRKLAVALARRVLREELTLRPEAIVKLAAEVLAAEGSRRRTLVLRLNPDDLPLVRQRSPELSTLLEPGAELALREDPTVTPHGVVLETEVGVVDAQLETQLAALERCLLEAGASPAAAPGGPTPRATVPPMMGATAAGTPGATTAASKTGAMR